jgi:hypothetical protein
MALRKDQTIAQIIDNVLLQSVLCSADTHSRSLMCFSKYTWQENRVEMKRCLNILSLFRCMERGISISIDVKKLHCFYFSTSSLAT